MGDLRISIALATFNGSAFLKEQLESYLSQTLLPAELAVADDGSTDDTLEIIKSFSQDAPFPVRLILNKVNQGPVVTFAKAITACNGDLIALSDQDDIWLPTKLERMSRLFKEDAKLGAAFCNAELVDAQLESQRRDMWDLMHLTSVRCKQVAEGDTLPVLLHRYSVQGSALMLRANLVRSMLPIPAGWHYDAWLAVVAAAESKLIGIPECLQKYRQHEANAIGVRSTQLVKKLSMGWTVSRDAYLADEVAKYTVLFRRLCEGRRAPSAALQLISEKRAHLMRRISMPKSRMARLPYVINEIHHGGYRHYSTDWRSVALDLLRY